MPFIVLLYVSLWRTSYVVLAGLVLLGCEQPSPSLDQVVKKNANATGGRDAIEAVKSIEVDLHIVDPGFAADGIYRATRTGKMRIDVMIAGEHVFTEACNGTRGWEWSGKGEAVDCSAAATVALRHGVELPGKLFGLHEMQARGHGVELLTNQQIEGNDYHVLRLAFADGYSTSLYVDTKSGLITRRREVRALHVDIDPPPTTIETLSSDFRKIAGVMFSFSNVEVDLKSGKVLERTTVRSVKVNPVFNERIFDVL